ncbi:MAG: dihydrolipoyl dehydrogenase [Phycisphaerales bacterium]|nr:dihydrolipoyl dehydrogenase [Phycisphaerales bacterium]
MIQAGQSIAVGAIVGVIATGKEKIEDVQKEYAHKDVARGRETTGKGQDSKVAAAKAASTSAAAPAPASKPSATGGAAKYYNYDFIVIGGGPAGYAAAIRAGQLKKRNLCIEKAELGGTCLNWGCIPTKALLDSGEFVRRMRDHAGEFGITFDNMKVDFSKIIERSRSIADKLSKGIAHLLRKYDVKQINGVGMVSKPNTVRITGKDGKTQEVTGEHIIIATGARARSLPGVEIDGQKVISAREAMTLKQLPEKLAVIGAGAIGCEFADFYNALGTKVTIVELQDHLLPIEDVDVQVVLERQFTKRGITVLTGHRTEKVERSKNGVRLTVTGGGQSKTIEADVCLMAVGVQGNVEQIVDPSMNMELFKNHVKVDKQYRSSVPGIWAVGDVVGPPWLAHVAHHEAVNCVERICGLDVHGIDYTQIPGCTYTHPQVASMGLTEVKARETGRKLRVGKFPFQASGRALAAGESDGFVKLIFDQEYGELLGVHMIGENVTELLAELVMAKKLEATEAEIIQAMHPHPTLSEAVMEAAGVADSRAIHF